MKGKSIYYLGLIFVSIVWGANFGISRLGMDIFPAEIFVLIRFGLAVPILFLVLKFKEGSVKVDRKDLLMLAIIGLFGITILEIVVMYSIKFTTLANASLLNVAPWPIFVALFAPLFTRERMTMRLVIGGGIAFIGVTLIILGGEDSFSLSSDYMIGNLLAFSISILGALFNLSCMPLMKKYSPLRITTWYILFGSIFLVPFTLNKWDAVLWSNINGVTWLIIFYNVVVCSVLAFIIWNVSMKQVGATKSNFFRYFVPAAASISGVFLFNEMISVAQIAGGIIIVFGLAWIVSEDKQKPLTKSPIREQVS